MTRWIVEKSDGFTDVGLYRISHNDPQAVSRKKKCRCHGREEHLDNIHDWTENLITSLKRGATLYQIRLPEL